MSISSSAAFWACTCPRVASMSSRLPSSLPSEAPSVAPALTSASRPAPGLKNASEPKGGPGDCTRETERLLTRTLCAIGSVQMARASLQGGPQTICRPLPLAGKTCPGCLHLCRRNQCSADTACMSEAHLVQAVYGHGGRAAANWCEVQDGGRPIALQHAPKHGRGKPHCSGHQRLRHATLDQHRASHPAQLCTQMHQSGVCGAPLHLIHGIVRGEQSRRHVVPCEDVLPSQRCAEPQFPGIRCKRMFQAGHDCRACCQHLTCLCKSARSK